ncbi:uncharacterized protein LOC143736071 [Siphateles boraxobius]|uniref:uncharacterized protein LOC143736071 n=1 Tax=Siphateles boraxobius TaxID=180520 RepID=UPI0040646DE7
MRWPMSGPTVPFMPSPPPRLDDSTSHQTGQRERVPSPSGGPSLENQIVVPGTSSVIGHNPMACPTEERPPHTGERDIVASETRFMGPSCLAPQRVPKDLPEKVLSTISEARAPSTRRLYASKWSGFSSWCSKNQADPESCVISVVRSFLQELLDAGCSPSTLKVYVAAIAAHHVLTAGQSLGRNDLVVRFLKGARRMNPSRPPSVPPLDLSTVLGALKGPPFEPLQSVDLKTLSLKTALLMALASIKRVGDLQALSVSPACLELGPDDSRVILKPRHGYVPKVLSTLFRAQVVTLSALPPSAEDGEVNLLCPV